MEDWTLLDEFRYHSGEGNLETLKEIVKYIDDRRLPDGFEDEWPEQSPYPYSSQSLHAGDTSGSTALHYAAANGHLEVARWLMEELDFRQQINSNGNTPLHWAALNGQLGIVQYFCEDPTLQVTHTNLTGKSPIDLALESGNVQVVSELECHLSAPMPPERGASEEEDLVSEDAGELGTV